VSVALHAPFSDVTVHALSKAQVPSSVTGVEPSRSQVVQSVRTAATEISVM
jgi:hypothetical protein